ncbi:hypothetical protein LAT59_05035 [Candidatus Gracilibacteria bacterium]|nr:hypothetical protein [Candidatus Gracilibacteria bacterium]
MLYKILPLIPLSLIAGFVGITNYSTPILTANTPDIPELQCSEYSSEFRQCVVANRNGTTRTITDFPCLQTTDLEKILYQVILDKKFKEYDEDILEYLVDLRMDKEASAEEPLDRIDEFARNFGGYGYYYQEYQELCERGILEERASCTGGIPLVPASWMLRGDIVTQECMRLATLKLDTYGSLAAHILGINKEEVLADRFTQSEIDRREGNNDVQDAFRNVVGYCGKIGDGLTHFTPNPLQ